MTLDLRPFLDEDVGAGDLTADIFVSDRAGSASIVCEEDAVVAGIEEACGIFALLGVAAEPLASDGDRVAAGTKVMSVRGPLKGLMTGERVALNFLMRMSGVATATASVVERVRAKDKNMRIAATRKTTPGFRHFEKKAVVLGGGWGHRNGLYDMVMIKDNHIAAAGGVSEVLANVGKVPKDIKVEIEVANVKDGVTAAKHRRVDVIMADHMPPKDVATLRGLAKALNGNVLIEASGNITLENVLDYAGCADVISLGALTHSARAVHFSMDVDVAGFNGKA
ncbi:MAG: carboxylating nicotinate-nucleotide diphosphorylase [Candidatus Methanoplasma sp.]|jgi:nicotinate-nucleotide pyrophosphorylase (carboxylating)|nr:carboxylating nicotinate-nucleotide diphosphorylase [Candidatus Methanoplasma sp.]